MTSNRSFNEASREGSTMGGLSRIHLDSRFRTPSSQNHTTTGMGGLSRIHFDSRLNPPSQSKNTHSGMGGLSQIAYPSNLHSKVKTAHIPQKSSMGGLSRIHPYEQSRLTGQARESSGMGGMSRMHVESLVRDHSSNMHGTPNQSDSSGSIRTTLMKTVSNEAFKQAEIKFKGSQSEVKSQSK